MKVLCTLLTASALLSPFAFAESATSVAVQATHQAMEQEKVQNKVQNRFQNVKTDELLEKRGTMTQQQEREQLHNELKFREKTMTQEQKRRFDQRPPENRVKKGMGSGGGMGGGGKGGR